MSTAAMQHVVVGLDGSAGSVDAARWAAGVVAAAGRVHAVHVIRPGEELALDAVLGDSVEMRHHRERELTDEWLAPLADAGVVVEPTVREGPVVGELLALAAEVDAAAIVVGHHPHPRFGPQLVGHVTAELLRRADRPVVVVPVGWDPVSAAGMPVAVGVGVAAGTRHAIRWALESGLGAESGVSLVHALGPRSLFRPDGVLDVLGYHIDPTVLPKWVEEDITELAEQIRADAGIDPSVDVTVDVRTGRTGARLVEAGEGAQLLVIGRGEPAFVRRHAIAPYLHHALVDATCPVAVIPADEAP